MKAGSDNPVSPLDASHGVSTTFPRPCGAIPPAQSLAAAQPEAQTLQVEPPPHTLQMLAHASAMRGAKVRALRQAVEQGTYRVSAEQLAAKMLQDALQEILPNASHRPRGDSLRAPRERGDTALSGS
jgi:flagellar biosynthesis anti-sigma factor FlgM